MLACLHRHLGYSFVERDMLHSYCTVGRAQIYKWLAVDMQTSTCILLMACNC